MRIKILCIFLMVGLMCSTLSVYAEEHSVVNDNGKSYICNGKENKEIESSEISLVSDLVEKAEEITSPEVKEEITSPEVKEETASPETKEETASPEAKEETASPKAEEEAMSPEESIVDGECK